VKLIELLPGFARTTLPITPEAVNIHKWLMEGHFLRRDQACEAAGNSFGDPAVALQQIFTFLLRVDPETSSRPPQRWFTDPTESV